MSHISVLLEQYRIKQIYRSNANKEDLIQCGRNNHVPEDEHFQKNMSPGHPSMNELLKDSYPRRCKHCGVLLRPEEWEPIDPTCPHVEPIDPTCPHVEPTKSQCIHENIGYYGDRQGCRFPQKCKHCGILLKPKTWTTKH
jgi:hypothetical protein